MPAGSTRRSKQVGIRGNVVVAPVLALAAVVTFFGAGDRRAQATSADPARLRVAASLIDELVRQLLPLDIVLPAPLIGGPGDGGALDPSTPVAVTITDLRYCGVTDKGTGRWRAVLRAGGRGGVESALLAGDEACRQSLEVLARRPGEGRERDEGTGYADVEAVWRQWELRLVVVRMLGAGASKPGGPRPLVGMENRRDLLVISTANFRVITDGGDTLTFHAAPSFAPDAIELLTFLGENGAGPPRGRPGAGGHFPSLSDGMTVAAELPDTFANQILRQLTATRPLTVPIDRDVIDVQNVTMAGTSAGLTVTGMATPRSLRESVRLTVQLGGDEARVATVRAEGMLESCAGLGTLASMGCSARNAARATAAAALAAALTQKYRGQLVRDLAGPLTMGFDPGGRRLELRGVLLHVTAGARGVAAGGRLSAGGGADH